MEKGGQYNYIYKEERVSRLHVSRFKYHLSIVHIKIGWSIVRE